MTGVISCIYKDSETTVLTLSVVYVLILYRILWKIILTLTLLFLTACNVGDEGGFAPNIQDNKEGELSD